MSVKNPPIFFATQKKIRNKRQHNQPNFFCIFFHFRFHFLHFYCSLCSIHVTPLTPDKYRCKSYCQSHTHLSKTRPHNNNINKYFHFPLFDFCYFLHVKRRKPKKKIRNRSYFYRETKKKVTISYW